MYLINILLATVPCVETTIKSAKNKVLNFASLCYCTTHKLHYKYLIMFYTYKSILTILAKLSNKLCFAFTNNASIAMSLYSTRYGCYKINTLTNLYINCIICTQDSYNNVNYYVEHKLHVLKVIYMHITQHVL